MIFRYLFVVRCSCCCCCLFVKSYEWIEALVYIDAHVFACKMFLIENNKVSGFGLLRAASGSLPSLPPSLHRHLALCLSVSPALISSDI